VDSELYEWIVHKVHITQTFWLQ